MQKPATKPLPMTLLDDKKYKIVLSNTRDKYLQFERYYNGVFEYSFSKCLTWESKQTKQEPLCLISIIPVIGTKLNQRHSLAELKQQSMKLFICDRVNWKTATPQQHLSRYWNSPCIHFLGDRLIDRYSYMILNTISSLGYDGKRLVLGIPNNGSKITLGDLVKLLSFTNPKELLGFRNVGPKKTAHLYSIFSKAGISLDPKNYL
ncbi:hypothetical protein MM213_00050 [Belliella sp. R4-6]|uniref:RNA polymerase alpha subunit C-terminal domain-containing protein n=1 Tax=Belliella alkalica TaxID=1730871 RepID=A0ABS9V605_9BACT|nr:hypothetical protein [Belliella alkalica]MCH7411859.1 hypothetical protein [Belliella alkalica]